MSNLHTEKLLIVLLLYLSLNEEPCKQNAALGSNPAAGLLPSIDGE